MFTEVPWPWIAVGESILLLAYILIAKRETELVMKLEEELRRTKPICFRCGSIVSEGLDEIASTTRGPHLVP